MEKKEHPHAQVLRWIADGEEVEARRQSKVAPVDWTSTSHAEVLSIIRYGETGWEFRLKPTPMCELAGIRFPVPMKESPEEVEEIWVAATDGHFLDILGPSEFDKYLSAGVCHTTEEAAKAHSEALRAVNLMAIEGAK